MYSIVRWILVVLSFGLDLVHQGIGLAVIYSSALLVVDLINTRKIPLK